MDFQSMLAKSTSGTAANRGPIISKADVGLRVLVGGGVSGTLRYVGPIIGKDGIFCGVELDYPEGKHNGSFQGVAYFHCPPQHGIFAPLYKVELDGSEPPRNPVTISQLKRPTKLVKSSIATFRSPVQSMMMSESSTSTHIMENSTASTSGVDMDVSMMSTASSNFSNFLDTSLIMNASGVGEEMVTSNATYVICRGAREDEIMNVSEPELPIMLSDESDEDDVIVAANFKNGNATFGETTFEEDDLKTPMAEFYTAPMTVAPASDNTSQRSLSEMSVDTGYHGESDASLLSAGSSFRAEEPEKPEKAKQPIAPIKEETETPKTPPSKPKKERVSLMEQIQQQAKPAQPRAPKAPSKHQLMMEKLKASIAADKVKPKREIKSKLAATIAPVPPTQQAPTANGEMAPAANGTPATPKRTAKTAVNGTASKMAMPPPPPPRVPKPRQPLYVAPPPKERPPKKLKEPTVSRAPSQVSIQSTSTTATTRTKTAAPKGTISGKPFPTSSFAPSTSKIAKKSAVPSTPAAKKEAEAKAKAEAAIALEKLKAERLRKAIDYGDAMVLLYKREYDGKRKVGEENVKLGQQIDSLRREMGDQQEDATLREQRLTYDHRRKLATMMLINTDPSMTSSGKKLRMGSTSAVVICASLIAVCSALCLISDCGEQSRPFQNRWLPVNICIYILGFIPLIGLFIAVSKSYEERIREILRNHEAEEERWQEETAKIHRQHQLKCAELDGKLADASEQAERLKRDKRRLEATLAEDEHTKIKTLSAEIQSLNMALEMKSEEMKDMRQKNAALLLRVEEIPCKEQEIQKLKYKVKESQQEIHRLRETEKTLTTQYEDLQRSARKFVAKTEEIAKENDLLRYQMEESMTQSPSPCSKSLHMDTPVRFRGIKPGTMSATLPARVTQSTYGDLDGYDELNRSVISMYQQRGRPQSCNVDTIYAPEGTYTGDVLDEDCDTQKCMVNVTDSGIGLSHH